MTRKVVLSIQCDFCGTALSEDEAHQGELTLDGKHYGVDLCDKDREGLLEHLVLLSDAVAKSKKKAAGRFPCDEPGCRFKSKSEQGLSLHKRRMHPTPY